jgi:hypothetical protein
MNSCRSMPPLAKVSVTIKALRGMRGAPVPSAVSYMSRHLPFADGGDGETVVS